MSKGKTQAKKEDWTKDSIQKAVREHYYVKFVNGKGRRLLLSGAVSRWKKDENSEDVYAPEARLVGKLKEIREFLSKNGLSKDLTTNVYSRDNVSSTMKEQFSQELKKLKEHKKSAKTGSGQSLRVTDVVNGLRPSGSGTFQRDQTILQKWKTLGNDEEYVLDVSSMKSDGSGIKKRKKSTLRKQYSTQRVASSSGDNLRTAMTALKFSDEDINQSMRGFEDSQSKKKEEKPKKSTSKSKSSSSSKTSESKSTSSSSSKTSESTPKENGSEPKVDLAKKIRSNMNRGMRRKSPKMN